MSVLYMINMKNMFLSTLMIYEKYTSSSSRGTTNSCGNYIQYQNVVCN